MILTTCAACAAPLAHNAPRCVRCWTRYCDSTCQHDHWRRGHKQMCKKIHRGGNAEQYNADKKYKEAVAVAVEACADDTKIRSNYACALFTDPVATLDDLREAVTTLEETERIARRVLGSVHPLAVEVERDLGKARVALRAREMSPGSA